MPNFKKACQIANLWIEGLISLEWGTCLPCTQTSHKSENKPHVSLLCFITLFIYFLLCYGLEVYNNSFKLQSTT